MTAPAAPTLCTVAGAIAATSRVVVALCEAPRPADGDGDLRIFTGALEGPIPERPRGPAGRGWDRLFVPDGYRRSFAELGVSTYLVNMRHQPYLDLADDLRCRGYGGAFEAHITVRYEATELPRFAELCDRLEIKHIVIELASGQVATQPMTASVHRGELRAVQAEVHELARSLVAIGYDVARTKIKALPHNRDIPDSDAAASAEPARYFGYHLKIVVPPGGELAAVAAVAAAHGGDCRAMPVGSVAMAARSAT